jgi:hypothetical protein
VQAPAVEEPAVEDLTEVTTWRQEYYLTKQLQYQLLKRHFLKTFFHDASMKFDFVFYIELCHIGGMTSSFEIGIGEWLVLFVACILTTRDAAGMKVYHIYTIACVVLLIVSIVVAVVVTRFFGDILTSSYDIDNPSNLDQLSAAAGKRVVKTGVANTTGEHAKTKHHSYFHNVLSWHTPHFHLHKHSTPNGLAPARQRARGHRTLARPELKKLYIWGVGLTERTLCKFVQRQLLVICFYMAVFLMSYINMYRSGKMPGSRFTLALGALATNLFVVMPFVMFLGFR